MYKFIIISNQELSAFEDKFKSGGDYENYEIVNASFTGVATLFVLKESVE